MKSWRQNPPVAASSPSEHAKQNPHATRSLTKQIDIVLPYLLSVPTLLHYSEECQKPQPPLLLKKYRNTPPICIAIRLQFVLQYFWCPLRSDKKGNIVSTPPICIAVRPPHLYCSTPPICIAVLLEKSWWSWSSGCLPITAPYFWTIAFGHCNIKITSQKLSWNYFGRHRSYRRLSDFHTVISGDSGLWEN